MVSDSMDDSRNRGAKKIDCFRKVQELGWPVLESDFLELSDYNQDYLCTEFGSPWSPEKYLNRLKTIGFQGHGTVIDVGCGMGQWSYALSTINHFVYGIDINLDRLHVAEQICKNAGIENVKFLNAKAEELPFETGSVDAIYCYSMIMFVSIEKVLPEFNRVLRTGGRIYLNTDSVGYYLDLIYKSLIKEPNIPMVLTSLRFVVRGLIRRDVNASISPRRLKRLLVRAGFEVIAIAPEGMLNLDKNDNSNQKYQSSFFKFPYVTEGLAIKGDEPSK
jgi:ubiquinone/menaquinone biosynthesis C-methylase UbiE